MKEHELKYALESARLNRAIEVAERNVRQEAEPEEIQSVKDQDEQARRLMELTTPLGAEFEEAMVARFLEATKPASEKREKPEKLEKKSEPGELAAVTPISAARKPPRRWPAVQIAALSAAAAAFLVVWQLPMGGTDTGFTVAGLTGQETRSGAPGRYVAEEVSQGACVSLLVDPAAQVHARLATRAYFLKESQVVPWELSLTQGVEGPLTTRQCAPLPSGLTPGKWTLLLLIGRRGRLWWSGDAALDAARQGQQGAFAGIQIVRRNLAVLPEPSTK